MTEIDVAILDKVVGGLSGDEATAAGAGLVTGAVATYLGAPWIPWFAAAGGVGGLGHGVITGARDGYRQGGVGGAIGGAVARGISEGADGVVAGAAALPVAATIGGYKLAKTMLK